VANGVDRIRRAGVSITYESRDNHLLPTQGSLARLSIDYAGGPLGGEYEFVKSRFEFQHHMRIKKDKNDQSSVLQFKVTADHVEPYDSGPEVPFYERFYAGGFGTIRGFDYRSVGPVDNRGLDGIPDNGDETYLPVGGKVRLLSTLEYTYPLSPDSSLRGSIFYDAGNVWECDSLIDFDNIKQSAGVGLLIQPAGFPVPISLYLGWIIDPQPEDDAQIVSFMIGTMFF
jgi:outer membrane protein insertion porin family